MSDWINLHRPGYFGRKRDEIVANLNGKHGPDGWRLRWLLTPGFEGFDFVTACKEFYEASYYLWLKAHPEAVDFISSHTEVYDNALSNIGSGLDYSMQESYSTHIQDIAIRNALVKLSEPFRGIVAKPLQIRGNDEGKKFNPGHIPFFAPGLIIQSSIRPTWAEEGSVEDFWQSNKYIQVRKHVS